VYRVSGEEKELEKKEDGKTKVINILLSFLLSTKSLHQQDFRIEVKLFIEL